MADVILTEDSPDIKTEPSPTETVTFENKCGMTLKQDGSDSDSIGLYTPDGSMLPDDIVNPDDLLPPVVKLEKYASSEISFNRQVVARNILETLRLVAENEEEVSCVVNILCTLSDDYEPGVRAELMEQIPHIAAFCHENYIQLNSLIQQYMLPMIIKYLTDVNNQVRKTSQSSLLLIVEQGLFSEAVLEEKICPLILQLTESTQMDDHRTEAVTLMSKLALLIGKDVTERLFLKRFAALCLDPSFHVRKVCAASFGDFCAVVEREATEKELLPQFFSLCDDSVWGVRKACAEVFMPVSCVCSMETRHKELAPVYMNLLCDQSRWVRMASFQALGPFISTFAEPSKTGLYYNKEGVLTIVDVPSSIANRTIESTLVSQEFNDSLNSESDSCDSNVKRISCNSCDIAVPSSGVSNSYVQSTTSCSGNYCTVIELSSPVHTYDQPTTDAKTLSDSKYTSCDATDEDTIPLLNHNSHSPDSGIECDNSSSLCDKVNHCPSDVQSDSDILTNETTEEFLCSNDSATVVCNGELMDCLTNDVDCLTLEATQSDVCCKNTTACQSSSAADCCHTNTVTVNRFPMRFEGDESSESQLEFSNCQNGLADLSESDDAVTHDIPGSCEKPGCSVSSSVMMSDIKCNSAGDSESAFNHFQFWRTPLPDVEFEVDQLNTVNNHTARYNQTRNEQSRKYDYDDPIEFDSKCVVPFWSSESCAPSRGARCVGPLEHPGTGVSLQERCLSRELAGSKKLRFLSASLCNDYECASIVRDLCNSDETSLSETDVNCCDSDNQDLSDSMEQQRNPVESFVTNRQQRKLTPRNSHQMNLEPPHTTQNLFSAHDQDIVPPELLLRYLSMTDASRAQSVDAEIARHCAYSLPAVALTLGRRFWPCLKETYYTLASGMQGFIMHWKVRRTLASSMHQLAVILGPDIAAQDLLPIFSSFLIDLDEVRIGILQHLSEFLSVLRPKERKDYLPRLPNFHSTDNARNWRFRLILAEQLISIADLYEPADVREHLVPLTLALVKDKVSEVRLIAVRVMAVMMRRMSQSPTPTLTKEVLSELAEQFIHAPKWLHRQLYVYLCQEFVKENSLPPDQFAEDAMPHLLYLCWDRVANVRLAIARCLSVVIWPKASFSDPHSPHCELLLQAIHTLQSDVDADVRYFANMVAAHECSCLQHSMLTDLEDPPV